VQMPYIASIIATEIAHSKRALRGRK